MPGSSQLHLRDAIRRAILDGEGHEPESMKSAGQGARTAMRRIMKWEQADLVEL